MIDAQSRLIETESQRLAHVGSWEWDASRDSVTWSEELYRIYGLNSGEFSGTYEGFLRNVHPDDREHTSAVIASALKEAKPFNYDHRIVRTDGAVRMLQTRGDVVRGSDGSVMRMVGCCMDVTEQWETERRLDASLALLRATLESTADGIFVLDLSGKLVISNQRALTLWGVPEEIAARGDLQEMIARVRDELADPDAFFWREMRLMAEPAAKGFDTIRFKDGRVFERYTQPQRIGERIVGRVCSFRDVTERERALADLRKLAAELEDRVQQRTADLSEKAQQLARSNVELEMFASAAAHDLSSPVRKISAFAQLLEEKASGKLDAHELALLGKLRKAAADMIKLIGDVLELARASRDPLPVEDVNLNTVMVSVLADVEIVFPGCGASIETEALPTVRGHTSLWRRLLQNLIVNAIKFRAPDRPPRVLVRACAAPDGGTIISISDNGIGFDPKFAQEIFLPFHRLHASSEYDGNGIGLAICERVARRYGGTVTACGEPGRGATISVGLPASALAAR